MPYKVHILEINVLAYLQRVAMLNVLIITMLEMIMLSMLPKVPAKIKLCLWIASKQLNICMKKDRRTFMFGMMYWGNNLDFVIYSNY